jgi:hypothetical protein
VKENWDKKQLNASLSKRKRGKMILFAFIVRNWDMSSKLLRESLRHVKHVQVEMPDRKPE